MYKKTDKISKEFEKAIKADIFPGAVFLCALKEKILFYEAFGLADIFETSPMLRESIFDLASLTKPLATTLAIARLIEKKLLGLNTEISEVLEKFCNTDKAKITVDMLLRHSSGLPAHKNYYSSIASISKSGENPQQYLNSLLLQEKLEYTPGTQELYSDLGFMILAMIIERISGMRLDSFVTQEIYKPLGIEDMFFIDLNSEDRKSYYYKSRLVSTRYCNWRKKVLSGEVDDDNAFAVGGIDGHAGLFGDAKSVWVICLEILRALQNNSPRVLVPEIMQQFAQIAQIAQIAQKDKTCKGRFERVAGFDTPSATGSSSGCFFSKSSIGHLGYTGTSFWIDPEKDWIVILLTNRVHPDVNNQGIKSFRPLIHDLAFKELYPF